MRRRLMTLAGPIATATLAVGTAAWAAAGDVPLAPGDEPRPLAVSAQATGPLVSNDRDGSAIFSASTLVPGQVETGEVTIANAGDATGSFTLSATGASGPLAGVLDLTVLDATGARTVFTGKLAAFARADLGTFAAGDAHRYRFALAYPNGTPAVDNQLQGATTSVEFAWDAVATEAARPNPTPLPTPAPAAPPTAAPAAATPAAPASAAPASAAPAATPVTAAPAPAPAAAITVALGTAPKPVSGGRLVTWMSSSTAATARVTGTVSYASKRAKLPAATVKLTAKRRTVRLKLPAAAVKPGANRRLAVRLTIAATAAGRTTTVKRTLRVTAP
jgi:hypothetical protein